MIGPKKLGIITGHDVFSHHEKSQRDAYTGTLTSLGRMEDRNYGFSPYADPQKNNLEQLSASEPDGERPDSGVVDRGPLGPPCCFTQRDLRRRGAELYSEWLIV